MNIKTTHVIKQDPGGDERPDAVIIDIVGVTVTVNLHNGVVTVEGASHAGASEGDHNTLKVHACPDLTDMKGVDLLAGLGQELFPGVRLAGFDDLMAMFYPRGDHADGSDAPPKSGFIKVPPPQPRAGHGHS